MRIGNDTMIPNGASSISMGSSFELDPVWLGHICNYAIQLVFTGTPAGNFKLQASNDLGRQASGAPETDDGVVNWTDIAGSQQTISAAGDHMWQVENAGYRWVRVVWTQTSSTGTLTSAKFNVKGV